MADSCCIVELKETIEKLNVELSQTRAKISELDAKVREQEEENTRLTRDLKECEETCRATQERLKFAEQKLAQFSHKPHTAAQIRRNLINDGPSCSDGSDSGEDRRNLIIDSSPSCSDGPDSDDSPTHVRHPQIRRNLINDGSNSCSDGPDSDDSPTHVRHPQIRRNLINDGSNSCSDGSDSDEDRRYPIIDSSPSCSDGPDSDDSPTHVRLPQIRRNLINDGSNSCSDGSDSDEDRQNPIIDSSPSCSDGSDSDDSPTHVRHPQISFPLVGKEENSGVVKYGSNMKHVLKRKKPDEETKENNSKTIKLTSRLKGGSKIKESSDAALNINSMPEEIFIKIFGYLSHNDLGQTAQVCTRWNALSRNPDLWEKVNVDFGRYRGSQNFVAESLINILPPRVSSLRLDFWNSDDWIDLLNFEEISVKLQQRCPILEMLTLENAKISVNLPSIINLSTMLLQNLRRLALHSSIFPNCPIKEEEECGETCKIEALDLYGCYITHYNKPPLSNMPYLKKLYLSCTDVDDSWFEDVTYFLKQLHVLDLRNTMISSRIFQVLQIHAPNLRELYLCDTDVDLDEEDDINFNISIFPHLKTICLRHNGVSCEGIISLIKACKSLQNVYVEERVVDSYQEHPFVNYNECKLGIVKDDCCSYN